jgi:hypothetical protein
LPYEEILKRPYYIVALYEILKFMVMYVCIYSGPDVTSIKTK